MAMQPGAEIGQFDFTDRGINSVLAGHREALAVIDFDIFEQQKLAEMASFNGSLLVAHDSLVTRGGDDQMTQRRISSGFMLGFDVLKASTTGGLLAVPTEYAVGYTNRATGRPELIAADVAEDFSNATPLLDLLAFRIQTQAAREAARAIIGMHGKQANPGREPRDISLPPLELPKEVKSDVPAAGGAMVSLPGMPGYPEHPSARRSATRRVRYLTGSQRFGTQK
jgi:hypothetical protein